MRIAFFTDKELSPYQGGIERVTNTLCGEFTRVGHICYSCYVDPLESAVEKTQFADTYQIGRPFTTSISDFLQKFCPDVLLVNLSAFELKKQIIPLLYQQTRGTGIRVVVCYHLMPASEYVVASVHNALYRIWHRYDVKPACKDLLLHLMPKCIRAYIAQWILRKKYWVQAYYSDRFVLLSSHYVQPYQRLARLDDVSKYTYMPNALTFKTYICEEELQKKEKLVVVMARMHEWHKRISATLDIWAEVEKDPSLADWKLVIGGTGQDLRFLQQYAQRLNLKRCELLGKQVTDVASYYKRASIMMMTSAVEGLPMTITEAQQMGCVPIVYDSFEAVYDLIDDGKDGVIVPNDCKQQYVSQLCNLMRDTDKRTQMSRAGIDSSKRFEQEKITQRWMQLFKECELCTKSLS